MKQRRDERVHLANAARRPQPLAVAHQSGEEEQHLLTSLLRLRRTYEYEFSERITLYEYFISSNQSTETKDPRKKFQWRSSDAQRK